MVRGITTTDEELNQIGIYYKLGSEFGFTPKEVNEIDTVVVKGLCILIDAVHKEDERLIKNGGRR